MPTKANACPRCLTLSSDEEDGNLHTCTPTSFARGLEEECERLRAQVEELTRDNADLRSVMAAAALELHEHWDAHCDPEGYGPANLMRRLEDGIPSDYRGLKAEGIAATVARAEQAEARVKELRTEILNECIALHDAERVLAPIGNSAWGEALQLGWIEGTSAYRDAIAALKGAQPC